VIERKQPILKAHSRELPALVTSKIKAMVCISSLDNEIKLMKKGKSTKDTHIFYYPNNDSP
jgi:lipid A disaccharide synthetase